MNKSITNIKECSCCRYETEVQEYEKDNKEKVNLCDLCAGTITSRLNEYINSHDTVELMKTICYVGNAILDAITYSKSLETPQETQNKKERYQHAF